MNIPKEVLQSHILPFIPFIDAIGSNIYCETNLISLNKLFSTLNYKKYCYHYTQPHGKLTYYSPETKEVSAIVEYKEGLKHGLQRVFNHKVNLYYVLWFENKDLYAESEYKNGVENGFNRIYDKDKNLLIDANYLNGKVDGLYTTYYSNGKIKDKLKFKEGKFFEEK